MFDKNGRAYAKLSELKPGNIVEVDEGFDCIESGEKRQVHEDEDGVLYITCALGTHTLDGQLDYDNKGYLIGVYHVK